MNLLFAIDDNFTRQLETLLLSVAVNTPGDNVHVYVLQSQPLKQTAELKRCCELLGMTYHPVLIDERVFDGAPVTDRYPKTIYYRLLAHRLLPETVHKILYLDADILCINDLTKLYETDLNGYLYASAIHTGLTGTTEVINKIRLQNFDADGYYNSGVLLMNLDAVREEVQAADIFDYIKKHVLLLPDQDVLNALYGDRIKSVPDQIYNYDTRKGPTYETISLGEWTLDWVMKHTVILHYCGRDKPWQEDVNRGRYTALYKHYWHLRQKLLENGMVAKMIKLIGINH